MHNVSHVFILLTFFVAIFITSSMKIIPTRSILEEEKNNIQIHIKA